MEINVIDTREGIVIYNMMDGHPSQINTMYIDKEVYGISGLYINRLVVSENVRNRGIATKMMEKLVEVVDQKGVDVVLEINPYGDLDREKLEIFYKKFGFTESQLSGLYVRYANRLAH